LEEDSKERLWERFEVGLKYFLASHWSDRDLAAEISAQSLGKFEEAWSRGKGECLASKNGKKILSVETYGHLIAECMLRKIRSQGCEMRMDALSRKKRLEHLAWLKYDQLTEEAGFREVRNSGKEPEREKVNRVRYGKRLLTQRARRWGIDDAEIGATLAKLPSKYPQYDLQLGGPQLETPAS
jgi:hypothetical protein